MGLLSSLASSIESRFSVKDGAIVLLESHDLMTESKMTMTVFAITGLDSFVHFAQLVPSGKYTLSNDFAWSQLGIVQQFAMPFVIRLRLALTRRFTELVQPLELLVPASDAFTLAYNANMASAANSTNGPAISIRIL